MISNGRQGEHFTLCKSIPVAATRIRFSRGLGELFVFRPTIPRPLYPGGKEGRRGTIHLPLSTVGLRRVSGKAHSSSGATPREAAQSRSVAPNRRQDGAEFLRRLVEINYPNRA